MDNYSLSDLASVCGGNHGNNDLLTLLILFGLFGNGGFGVGGRNQCATTDELSSGFNFAGVNNSLKDIMLGQANANQILGNAICQSTYEIANKVDNGNSQILMAIKDLGADLKDDKIAQLQQTITGMQIQQATCGIPKSNPYAWGLYPFTCQPNCYQQNI